jgi:hypothetical protein
MKYILKLFFLIVTIFRGIRMFSLTEKNAGIDLINFTSAGKVLENEETRTYKAPLLN